MKSQKSNLSISRTTSTIVVVSLAMLLCALNVTAQFTFNGGYDTSWGVTNGYTIDPTDIIPELPNESGALYTAQLLPDGSIIAGGRIFNGAVDYFYVKKYTPNGAVDTTFGTNGIAVVNFLQRLPGSPWDPATIQSTDLPTKLVVQPDGKILFGAQCMNVPAPLPFTNPFGTDACLIRLNSNGSIDTTFGNNLVRTAFAGGTGLEQWTAGPGRLLLMTGTIGDGALFGTGGVINDIAVQADGRIILVGYARDHSSTFSVRGWSAFIIRLNPNGTPDATFGTDGIARYVGTDTGTPGSPCWTEKRFFGVKLQPDGRILAIGHSGANLQPGTGCQLGTVFAVTRWSASGVMETERTFTHVNILGFPNNTAFRAAFVKGGKVLVSGSNANKAIITRLDLNTLSVDPTFAVNGFMEYPTAPGTYFLIEAIQADGKILGRDTHFLGGIVRFNPNGSSDQSFGNESWNGTPFLLGRTRILTMFPTGNLDYIVGSILVRPNGRINQIGYQYTCELGQPFPCYGIVTQQNTTARSGNHADFTNDGRAELAVFRPGEGNWYQRNSATGTSSTEKWGIASDSLAPADYDGDGRTDVAIFRSGQWWIHLSSNGAVRVNQFGTAGDLPRPGDFDGDGIADLAVFRPSNGTWYWLRSSDSGFGAIQWGANGDAPVLGDFDGDGRTDITIFREGYWYQLLTASDYEFRLTRFGLSGDIPVAGDYDGDSKTDIAVFRGGVWYVLQSSNGQFRATQWGVGSDRPVPADYDNDGKNDLAIYRGGIWWILFSGNDSHIVIQYGLAGDVPVSTAYLP